MTLNLKADRPRSKEQPHASVQSLQEPRQFFGNDLGIALTWCVCSTGN